MTACSEGHELTLIMVKPDMIKYGLIDRLQNYLAQAGLEILERVELSFSLPMVQQFYNWDQIREPHVLGPYLCTQPLTIWLVSGDQAIATTLEIKRRLRADYPSPVPYTLMHSSDSSDEFEREYRLVRQWQQSPAA